ncbi:AAA family ATPase [Falsiruegeria mediterranea]|uniref:DNA helicase n=1 Tax=Falsiruegeria mediterranea M17 TaxID=1200281 RepID=A0A2R8C738_9RHOB|nr:AAA family ATPase [Falsiruegeria mediterranea]SPJ28250.1 hypothetical protein TRM7615_01747 [Falsiruegeria mediterranea M17]
MNKLNNEQLNVARAIAGMQGGDRLVVSGRAGSGKTYAVTKAVTGRKALFLTPTHPAKAVLERELIGTSHKVTTIHSAIGWYKFKDQNLEDIEGYVPAHVALSRMASGEVKSGSFGDVDIIIVDEFSMVNKFLFDAIEDYATEFNLPVV